MGISNKLKELMEKDGTNANALAKKIKVPASTIHSILDRDSSRIEIDTIIRIAHEFDITADELLNAQPLENNCNLVYKCYGKQAYEIVMMYLSLNDAGKEAAYLQIQALAQSDKFLQTPKKENAAS